MAKGQRRRRKERIARKKRVEEDINRILSDICKGYPLPGVLDRSNLRGRESADGSTRMKSKIMYIEPGGGLARAGGRIGRVTFSQTRKTLNYHGRSFQSLSGRGYKQNYFDVETGEHYWISGPRRDGNDALYPMTVEIDDDAREEYWLEIRKHPDLVGSTSFRSPGKYSRRKPYPALSVSGGTRHGGNRGGTGVRPQRGR
jgi:hypothetical protein